MKEIKICDLVRHKQVNNSLGIVTQCNISPWGQSWVSVQWESYSFSLDYRPEELEVIG
jgi:hypothetical protein